MITPTDIVHLWGGSRKEEPLDGYVAPEDKNWSQVDHESCEVECGEFLWGLVRYLKPDIIVETGTYVGFASACMGLALRDNGRGMLYTIEKNAAYCQVSAGNFKELELEDYITLIHGDSMGDVVIKKLNGVIDLLLIDGGNRIGEFEHYVSHLSPHGIALMHDALKQQDVFEYTRSEGRVIYAGRGLAII